MDFIFPGQDNCIVTTPLHIPRWGLRLCVILAQLALKVAADNPNLTIFCVQGHKLAILRYAYMFERTSLEHPVFRLGYVNDVDSSLDR